MGIYVLLFLGSLLLAAAEEAELKPILIDCGCNSSITIDGRRWVGDLVAGQNFTLNSSSSMVASASVVNGDPSYRSLYETARFFNSSSSYNFSVVSGSYCIRLHFYPFSVDNFNVDESSFDVMANNLKLVSKFNIPGEIYWKNAESNLNITGLVKEYFMHVNSNGLNIEFVPNFGSFAFVSAIEIIHVFDQVFNDIVNKIGTIRSKSFLNLGDNGMETMYRLNVGGPEIRPPKDEQLWRKWDSDESYMFSVNAASKIGNTSNISYTSINQSYAAPLQVYETARVTIDSGVTEKRFNVSWKFNVDPDFDYLIRLHFCELVYDKANDRVFKLYINNRTAAENYDVFLRAGGKNKAYHEDYVDAVTQEVHTLWLQMGSDSSMTASGTDALLNGIEIFKLSHNGKLAHAPEMINASQVDAHAKKPKSKIFWPAIGAVVGCISTVIILCAAFFCYWMHKKKSPMEKKDLPIRRPLSLLGTTENKRNARSSVSPANATGSNTAHRIGRRFTIAEIRAATRNFDESLVIGEGGFGKVYKGEIEEGTEVAIKRANPQSQQGLKEFETEIQILSKLRHRHLVSMIGYCDEKNEMILVYEYMANGTLRSHLFGSNQQSLTWKQRLEACIGAARGLHYLHTGAETAIIHRDVKTTNILLDENFVAKMADFGLSKDVPTVDHTHVSTAVKGSFGYLDPEYFRRQQLTQKSDVYSFGVVLFEVVCARPVIDPSLPREQINLAEWALRWQQKKSLEAIVDPLLEEDYTLESLNKLGDIAEKCLADEGKNRPAMGEVLWHLEYVLQMHEARMQNDQLNSSGRSEVVEVSFSLPCINEEENEACP